MRRAVLIGVAALVGGLIAVVTSFVTPPAISEASPPPTLLERLDEVGIDFLQVSDDDLHRIERTGVSADDALATAGAGRRFTRWDLYIGRLTDRDARVGGRDGPLEIEGRLVYGVFADDATVTVRGGCSGEQCLLTLNYMIFVDAFSGAYLIGTTL